jgi:uncharacterized membrane protein
VARKAPLTPQEYLGLRLGIALSFVGFVISGVLLLNHYHAVSAGFCGINEWTSCDVVNRSPYSEILGVPVALLGMLGFLAMAALSTARLVSPRAGLGRLAPPLLSANAAVGIGLGGYLTVVELFVLHLICMLCVASLLTFIAAVAILRHSLLIPASLKLRRGRREAPADGN